MYVGRGSYRTGWGGPGVDQSSRCSQSSPSGCHLAAIPSGPSPPRPTRILGSGPSTGRCETPPQLWRSERVDTVLNLDGSSNVEIGRLEVTDQDPRLANANMETFDPATLAGSALVDRVPYLAAAGRDLYHQPRPNGPAADIGAVERQAAPRAPRRR